jgi:hypothetical protein
MFKVGMNNARFLCKCDIFHSPPNGSVITCDWHQLELHTDCRIKCMDSYGSVYDVEKPSTFKVDSVFQTSSTLMLIICAGSRFSFAHGFPGSLLVTHSNPSASQSIGGVHYNSDTLTRIPCEYLLLRIFRRNEYSVARRRLLARLPF